MKQLFLLMMLIVGIQANAQDAGARRAVEVFFEAFHAGDTVRMKTVMAKGMAMHSITERKSGSVLESEIVAEFLKSIATIPIDMKFEERLLGWDVKLDGSMAHIWTPYEFYINGKLSHSGVNSFQLYNDSGVWKITYIIDTRRKSTAR